MILRRLKSKAIIVLGMHRSGTSVLTRALSSLGVSLGENLLSGDIPNPKGFFEDRDVISLNEKLLEEMNCYWDSILLSDALSESALNDFNNGASNLIKEKYLNIPLWALKDPRITRLQPQWKKVLCDLNIAESYVMANRHPLSVADSLSKRDNIPNAQALCLWLTHQKEALSITISTKGLVFDYDNIIRNPEMELIRLQNFLGLSPSTLHKADTEEFSSNFLAGNLRHSFFQGPEKLECSELGNICWRLHVHLASLSKTNHVTALEKDKSMELIATINDYLSTNAYWISGLDSIQRNERLKYKELVAKHTLEINSLNSKITYIESTRSYKVAKALKNMFKSLAFPQN